MGRHGLVAGTVTDSPINNKLAFMYLKLVVIVPGNGGLYICSQVKH